MAVFISESEDAYFSTSFRKALSLSAGYVCHRSIFFEVVVHTRFSLVSLASGQLSVSARRFDFD